MTSQLLLCEACLALGEHLASLLQVSSKLKASESSEALLGETSIASASTAQLTLRRQALNAFADAASYAARAYNYALVVHSARHYWNLTIAYWREARERATLFDTLKEVLNSWRVVFKLRPAAASSANESDSFDSLIKKDKKVIIFEIESKKMEIRTKNCPYFCLLINRF